MNFTNYKDIFNTILYSLDTSIKITTQTIRKKILMIKEKVKQKTDKLFILYIDEIDTIF